MFKDTFNISEGRLARTLKKHVPGEEIRRESPSKFEHELEIDRNGKEMFRRRSENGSTKSR